MTRAKFLRGEEKTLFVKASFEKKLNVMSATIRKWRSEGRKEGDFWPSTLSAFASWNNPVDGIYEWKTPNVMSAHGRYKDLVTQYWRIQKDAKRMQKEGIKGKSRRLKSTVQILGEQNTQLVWQVMELRDALMRRDPNDPVLKKISFP